MISQYNSSKIKALSLVAAFMVVQIHSCYGVGMSRLWGKLYKIFMVEGIYGFAVPFFFIVSGYFFMNRYDGSARWWIDGIYKRIRSLILPYFVWVILYICIVRFLFGDFRMKPLLDFGIITVTPANGSMWYVKVLFFMCIGSPLLIASMEWLRKCSSMVLWAFLLGGLMLGLPIPGFKTYWRAAFYFCIGIGISMGIFDKIAINRVVHGGGGLFWRFYGGLRLW